ncbi:MAG: glycosyl transferase [Epsilonproteobacteria bacterium]|nr:MAG: glycosyl transferase [Campylobacterota bacterium]
MRELTAKTIIILFDLLIITFSIYFADFLRSNFAEFIGTPHTAPLTNYSAILPLYILPIVLFAYEGIYTYRYDFWHESRLILKGILFSAILVFSYLAITKSIGVYSRIVIGSSFLFMALLIPISKNFTKKLLYRLGLWSKKAKIYGNDPFLTQEIYGNPYLGYIEPKEGEEPSTLFVNPKGDDAASLKEIISSQMQKRSEVIFIPFIDDYDLTHSHIYELSNTRTNLIVYQNRLKNRYLLLSKRITDMFLSILISPFLIIPMIYIAYRIHKEEPGTPILFKQKRLGQEKNIFVCYKFRTMYDESEEILQKYLSKNPDEISYYNQYHKYKNDPRITPIGKLLRRTSLDELPQIFNVFKQEMSFIGPRPYMLDEKEEVGDTLDIILAVRPGITGLWQVSGRSDVDFHSRIDLDVWYIRNWNLWMDLVILIKTIKTVFLKKGAQ